MKTDVANEVAEAPATREQLLDRAKTIRAKRARVCTTRHFAASTCPTCAMVIPAGGFTDREHEVYFEGRVLFPAPFRPTPPAELARIQAASEAYNAAKAELDRIYGEMLRTGRAIDDLKSPMLDARSQQMFSAERPVDANGEPIALQDLHRADGTAVSPSPRVRELEEHLRTLGLALDAAEDDMRVKLLAINGDVREIQRPSPIFRAIMSVLGR